MRLSEDELLALFIASIGLISWLAGTISVTFSAIPNEEKKILLFSLTSIVIVSLLVCFIIGIKYGSAAVMATNTIFYMYLLKKLPRKK